MGILNFFKKFFKQKAGKEKESKQKDEKQYICWDERYSVSVREFDDQHKKLVSMINELHNAMQIGKGKEVLASILNSMINYVGTHFSNEEKYMTQFSYPEYEKHKEQHNDFVKKTVEFQKSFNEGKLGLSIEVMFFLKDWTLNHIMGTDKQYGSFFNNKGLK